MITYVNLIFQGKSLCILYNMTRYVYEVDWKNVYKKFALLYPALANQTYEEKIENKFSLVHRRVISDKKKILKGP